MRTHAQGAAILAAIVPPHITKIGERPRERLGRDPARGIKQKAAVDRSPSFWFCKPPMKVGLHLSCLSPELEQ